MSLPSLQAISNPGQIVGAKLRPIGTPVGAPPLYGMSMWFTVSVPSLDKNERNSLGAWSACSGLDVNLTPDGPFGAGGNYTTPRYLPGKVTYNKVTLSRAMTPHGSTAVKQWLRDLAKTWVSGQESSKLEYPTVTITLYSAPTAVVHVWELKNAIPITWTMPQLSTSGGGGFAIETLVLQHGGFLEVPEQQDAAKFELVGPRPNQRLTFEFNPTSLKLSRSREAADGKKHIQAAGDNVIDADALSVDLNELQLEGCDNVKRGNLLLRDWLEFVPQIGAARAKQPPPAATEDKQLCGDCKRPMKAKDGSSPGTAKVLTVNWGREHGGMPPHVVLRKFDLTITRFTADGRPSRATVALKLQEVTPATYKGGARPAANAAPADGTDTSWRATLPSRGRAK